MHYIIYIIVIFILSKLCSNCVAGIIRQVHGGDDFTVDFARDCRVSGDIQWPNGSDTQRVAKKFILQSGFKPVTGSSGRIWKIPCMDSLTALFQEFSQLYFD